MSKVVEVMRAWLRARDKRRHGLWITHGSAKAAIQDLIDELDTAGFVVVPKEPTMQMLAAFQALTDDNGSCLVATGYRAMIKAGQVTP